MAKNITKLKHRFPLKQIRGVPSFLRLHWPSLSLILITLILFLLNYEKGTFFIGWDNFLAEFNPEMNLKRSLSAVWQEYQSLGLLGGMGHAADIIRQLFVLFLVKISVPINLIRYLSTLIPMLIGPLGVYYFLDRLVFKSKLNSLTSQPAAFFGGLFYLLNLGTMQTFFTPFETFIYFYGFFPWLIVTLAQFHLHPTLNSIFKLFVLSILATPSFYIETLFVVFGFVLIPFYLLNFKSIKVTLISSIAILFANLFWLLPVAFFVLTNGRVGELSKINSVSTPETYLRNLEFGNIFDLALLKGFWFNFVDLSGGTNKFDFMLSVWRSHLENPTILIIGYILFAVILTGFYYSIKKKFTHSLFITLTAAICLFFLAGGGLLLNQRLPLVGELFRSPFTKFSTPLIFCYSYFFAIGSVFLLDLFTILHSRFAYLLTIFTIGFSIVIFMSPAFSGHFLSPTMRRQLPGEYLELFSYLSSQDKNQRIANFPQNDFWGWLYYDWGYRGSGFLWYGIEQPILDRAFDVWSKTSEDYYQEINQAIYSNNWDRFDEILKKHQVDWILVDLHVISPSGNHTLKNEDLLSHLNQNKTDYNLEKNFSDSIFLYKTNENKFSSNFLSLQNPSLNIRPFQSLPLRPNTNLLTDKNQITLPSIVINSQDLQTISIPSFTQAESLIPTRISYQKAYGYLNLKIEPIIPQITVNDKLERQIPSPQFVTLPLDKNSNSLIIQIDKEYYEIQLPAEMDEFEGYYPLTEAYLPTKENFQVKLFDGSSTEELDITPDLQIATPYQCFTNKPNRKIEKINSQNSITLIGTDVVGCLSASLPVSYQTGAYSVSFTYSSPTQTSANISISNLNLGASDMTQPIDPTKEPKRVRIFSSTTSDPQKVNLILEANNSTHPQQIDYSDVRLYFHPIIYQTLSSIPHISSSFFNTEKGQTKLSISLPLIDSNYNIYQLPNRNQLLPEIRNCDQFNRGEFNKKTTEKSINYQSRQAIACDFLNLRHLPHSSSYILTFTAEKQSGLPMSVCLENHTTSRCDIYERLINSTSSQSLIQPITNNQEDPGYSLHLFNQSIGNIPTITNLNSIAINPFPLNFLQQITISSSDNPNQEKPSKSQHKIPHLYTVTTESNAPKLLNLYQSYSPYWQAFKIDDDYLSKDLITQVILAPYIALKASPLSTYHTGTEWFNSWQVTPGKHNILIVYTPQYLQYLGFIAILIFLTILVFLFSIKIIKTVFQKLQKKKK